ncbi:class I tRNA ligase family protein [Candidatus Carsonella ruddii]|uniref:isoleucine--tRNA ligase n=1 Tax=Carsonella ruddii TaxID=114186 RepID=A0A1U9RRN9_CARRU|nr:class I tRNA ligase family protein [Candidatus Carsonella ruddii]AQU89562.1 Isoleucyl-tRNA synthetase [Candidatus Carsonella ruddii]
MLNLPKKKYLMKANLNKIINFKNNIYYYLNNKIINIFLLDGPPFANGKIHIGHILNKTIKDSLIKFFYFKKYLFLSNLGWDCHGLPIEQLNFLNNLFFINCRKFVCNVINIQKKDFFSFNYFNNYFIYNTMQPRYESYQYKIFNYLYLNKIIKKEKLPILWCYKCCSSLSYSEILYKKINSYSFYIKIKLLNFFLIIWTTTIWSLINNQAVFFLKNQIYIIFKSKNNKLIFSNFLIYKIIKILKIKGKVCSFINGIFFLNKRYYFFLKSIFLYYNKKNIFLNNNFIEKNIGSGFIHCAPSNGLEDYEIYNKKKNINFFNKRFFIKSIKFFNNINVFYFSKIIFKILKKRKMIFLEKINHNYMFCWRHKKPIFYYLSNQIFIDLNFKFKNINIKKILLKKMKKIIYIPFFIKKILFNMINFRHNWCISRQRYWGVPIILNKNKICYYKNLIKTFGSHIIFYLEKIKKDIFDVWFDSSILFLFFKNKKIIIEGKDQIRGWYQSCIIINFLIYFNINLNIIISHGFCIDSKGEKLSKSSKNFKNLKDILKKYSNEIIKLFLLEHDYTKNIIFNILNFENTNFTYKLIRNFLKFLINNFYKFNFIKIKNLFFDFWIIKKTNNILIIINKLFLNFSFFNIIKIIKLYINFINELYIEYVKYNLYICKINSLIRNSSLFTLYFILIFLKNNLFPILSYSSNELDKFFKNSYKKIKNYNIFFSYFIKIKILLKKDIIFYKNFFLLNKIKKDFFNIFSKKIFIYNFFWNWYNNIYFFYKFKKYHFCFFSKNFKYINKYILNKNICNICYINKFHNLEEIRFYA